jgi:5'-nucleotidase
MKINRRKMRILITNDDGYQAKGIKVLADIMKEFGDVTVIAPKHHQSGMSMAVSIGFKQIAHKNFGNGWHYVDATPASCVKFGLNTMFLNDFPDVVVSGINHGSNAATASCYSGTLGAAEEAALNGIPAIGVSLDTLDPDADFSGVKKYFGEIFRKLMKDYPSRYGVFYNVNFPDIPADEIKGVCNTVLGEREYLNDVQVETEGEVTTFIYGGDAVLYESDENHFDVIALENGYASITPLQKDMTEYKAGDMLADWRMRK